MSLPLRDLLQLRPTPERRRRVEQALVSGDDPAARLATQILGRWGDRESTARLWKFFVDASTRPGFGWFYQDLAAQALRRWIRDRDAPWLLDHFFSDAGAKCRRPMIPLLMQLSNAAVRDRCISECLCRNRTHRLQALRLAALRHFREERELLEMLVDDDDPELAQAARRFRAHLQTLNRRRFGDPVLDAVVNEVREALDKDVRHLYIKEVRDVFQDRTPDPLEPLLRSLPGNRSARARVRRRTAVNLDSGRHCQSWYLSNDGLIGLEAEDWREIPTTFDPPFRDHGVVTFWAEPDVQPGRVHIDRRFSLVGVGDTFELSIEPAGSRLVRQTRRWISTGLTPSRD